MFDFEKLNVYQKAKEARKTIYALLAKKHALNKTLSDQLNRAIMAIILNIAEGTGKSSKADKRLRPNPDPDLPALGGLIGRTSFMIGTLYEIACSPLAKPF